MGEDSLLERVTAAAEERQLSQNSLIAYRRTCTNRCMVDFRAEMRVQRAGFGVGNRFCAVRILRSTAPKMSRAKYSLTEVFGWMWPILVIV